jgi:hypothetical protein
MAFKNSSGGFHKLSNIVHGKMSAIVMICEVKCEVSHLLVYAPTHSSDVHPASNGQQRGKAQGIRRTQMRVENENSCKQECMSRKKVRQPKCHSSTLSQQDQKCSEIGELRMKKCSTQSILYTVLFRSNRQSHLMHPPVDHELWLRSRVTRASIEPPSGHTGPKLPKKAKKDINFGSNAEIFEMSRKNSAAAAI